MPTENFRPYHDKFLESTNYDKRNIQLFGDETAEKFGSLGGGKGCASYGHGWNVQREQIQVAELMCQMLKKN
jgi:hypothetical protein